jgi:HD-GYP domain-containing protein (c-di-GMP phosphodiesterase class II)
MQGILSAVRGKLLDLGLNMSVWDATGDMLEAFAPGNDFCRSVCGPRSRCEANAKALVHRICTTSSPAKDQAPLGCCLVGVPILQRRRLMGAVVACFPVREMLEDEEMARLCDRCHLDRQVVAKYAAQTCRHGLDEADDFLRLLGWLLKQEQDAWTAQEELATFGGNLSSTYEELSLLYTVSGSMGVTQHPQRFLQNVCDELHEVMHCSVAALVYAHPPAVEQDIFVVAGGRMDSSAIRALGEKIVSPRLVQTGEAVVENESEVDEAFRNFIAVPLSTENNRTGMLFGFNKAGDYDTVDLKLLGSVGVQTAVFLANNRLYADLQDLLMGVLHSLTASIDAKDPYTCGHSQRVALLSRRLAELGGYAPARVERIYLAGLLHDVGKIGVPEAVLCKPGRLTDEEFEMIKRHPSIGAKILGGIRQLDDIVPGILAHHERPDGRGYPQGLAGEDVPIEGRIVGLADCFDAMTSDRTYRKALNLDAVVQEIASHAGAQFDPDLVEKFLSLDLRALLEELYSPARNVFPVRVLQEGSS